MAGLQTGGQQQQQWQSQPQQAPPGFGTLGYVNPSYVNPQQSQTYMDQYEQLFRQAMAPTFAQQDQQLQESDAARGISSSGAAAYLQGNLLGQQGAATAQGLMPIVSQGYGYSQQDLMANQNAANQASYYNAGTYNNYLDSLQNAYLGSFGPSAGILGLYGQGVSGLGSTYGGIYESAQQAAAQEQQAAAYAAAAGGGG